jgi:hypothetical protein
VTFTRREKSIHMEYRDPNKPEILGTAEIFGRGIEDHFQVRVAVADSPVLKALGVDSLPANLVIGDDPDDPDSPGKDYLTCSTNLPGYRAMTTVKLRRGYKKGSFLYTDETPNGKDRCRGTGYKQKPPKKKPS